MTSLIKKPAFLVAAVLALVGIGSWCCQLAGGLGVTGMNNSNSWGLYITCFMFFVGLSAGGLIVASSAHVFNIKSYKQVALPAVILSIACICIAGMFVLADLGGIQRVWMILTGPNVTSVLLWDVTVISLYLVINVLDLVFMVRGNDHAVEILSRFALPVAILVHSVTAWIFGLQIAKEWYSAIMAPIFVASAMDSGLALLILVLVGLRKAGKFQVEDGLIRNLAGLLCVCIAVDGYFIGCELLTMGYPGADGAHALSIMFSGQTAPFFWFEIICGLLIPFCLLVTRKGRYNNVVLYTACVLVVAGVFCKRVWLLFTSFVTPNIYGAYGITLGTSAAQQPGADIWTLTGVYAPTGIEIAVSVGVISIGACLFMILVHFLMGKESRSK